MYRPPKPKPEGTPIDQEQVNRYKHSLGLQNDPKIVRLPDDDKYKMNTPLSDVPDTHKTGFGPEDQNTPLGRLMGAPDHKIDDTPAQHQLIQAGGGGYSSASGTTFLDHRTSDSTLYHELGHQKQHEQGLTGQNTATMPLEYHNVLHNENTNPDNTSGTPPRTDYTLASKTPHPYPAPGQTWDSMRQDVNSPAFPEHLRAGTKQALEEIEQTTADGGGLGDKNQMFKQNLVAEYFRNPPRA